MKSGGIRQQWVTRMKGRFRRSSLCQLRQEPHIPPPLLPLPPRLTWEQEAAPQQDQVPHGGRWTYRSTRRNWELLSQLLATTRCFNFLQRHEIRTRKGGRGRAGSPSAHRGRRSVCDSLYLPSRFTALPSPPTPHLCQTTRAFLPKPYPLGGGS